MVFDFSAVAEMSKQDAGMNKLSIRAFRKGVAEQIFGDQIVAAMFARLFGSRKKTDPALFVSSSAGDAGNGQNTDKALAGGSVPGDVLRDVPLSMLVPEKGLLRHFDSRFRPRRLGIKKTWVHGLMNFDTSDYTPVRVCASDRNGLYDVVEGQFTVSYLMALGVEYVHVEVVPRPSLHLAKVAQDVGHSMPATRTA